MGPLDLIRAHLLWLEAGSPVQTLRWRTRRRDRQRSMTTLESHSGQDWLSTSLAPYKCLHAPQHWVAICLTSAQPQKHFALLLSRYCCKSTIETLSQITLHHCNLFELNGRQLHPTVDVCLSLWATALQPSELVFPENAAFPENTNKAYLTLSFKPPAKTNAMLMAKLTDIKTPNVCVCVRHCPMWHWLIFCELCIFFFSSNVFSLFLSSSSPTDWRCLLLGNSLVNMRAWICTVHSLCEKERPTQRTTATAGPFIKANVIFSSAQYRENGSIVWLELSRKRACWGTDFFICLASNQGN